MLKVLLYSIHCNLPAIIFVFLPLLSPLISRKYFMNPLYVYLVIFIPKRRLCGGICFLFRQICFDCRISYFVLFLEFEVTRQSDMIARSRVLRTIYRIRSMYIVLFPRITLKTYNSNKRVNLHFFVLEWECTAMRA